jgi:hypothetical protein
MVAVVRSNDLGGLSSADPTSGLVPCGGDVRELQRTLWVVVGDELRRDFRGSVRYLVDVAISKPHLTTVDAPSRCLCLRGRVQRHPEAQRDCGWIIGST